MKITDIPLRVYDLEGNWLEDVENQNTFNKKHNLKVKNAYMVADSKAIFDDKFQFRYFSNDPVKTLPAISKIRNIGTTPVGKYWNDRLICVYNSHAEAAEKNNITYTDVNNSVNKNCKIKGFLFKKI